MNRGLVSSGPERLGGRAGTLSVSIAPKPSFEEVVRAELPVLYRVARRITMDADAAEDLVGQTLMHAATGWAGFDGRFLRSWLIRIMRNAHRKQYRDFATQISAVPLQEADAASDTMWSGLDARLTSARIVAELDRIPAEYGIAVILCDMEELSYEEAARALEVPIGTVRSRLFRGRKLLRDRLSTIISPDYQ